MAKLERRLETAEEAAATDERPDIFVDQDLNAPPHVVAVAANTGRKVTFWDLNPQFTHLTFGKVEEIHLSDAEGGSAEGGLYFPPDYTPGKEYPLVIQTHGFDPQGFWIDGPHTTAFAAQPLAARGIVVLQLNDIFYDSLVTSREADRVMRVYERAIDCLEQKGIIDRDRVGLLGFSRTGLYVKYTLTHSLQHFAAAIVSDGLDAGYWQYLIFYNGSHPAASEFEAMIGAPPFGAGLSLWMKYSPGFLLDKVQAPLQIQALGPASLLGQWDWFSGLKRLDKPVDLIYVPNGTHILKRPRDRMASQQASVDWFCFWLKGEEDPDPAKAEQYKRWRELRKLQGASGKPDVSSR